MAIVPDLLTNPHTYQQAKTALFEVGMDIQLLGTQPPGQAPNRNMIVWYQNQAPGTEIDPLPIGFVVGVILTAPAAPPPSREK